MKTAYNAKDSIITYDGTYITGLGETMVEGEKDEEFFESSVGAQGDVVVSEKNDPLGTIKLTVQATSPQYQYLIKCAKNQIEAPLWVKNTSIGERFGGTLARIKKYPTASQGATADDRDFEFQVFDYTVENI